MRKLIGTIVSNKMTKTVVVEVEVQKHHAKYQKTYQKAVRFKAHAETPYQVGDLVVIEATRPLSKEKRWKVASRIREAAKKSE